MRAFLTRPGALKSGAEPASPPARLSASPPLRQPAPPPAGLCACESLSGGGLGDEFRGKLHRRFFALAVTISQIVNVVAE
ncbi:MAG: hypothetical protein RJA70_712 [Pseudomonadota bacterium]